MAWIESHDDIWDHWKTHKVMELLKLDDVTVVGHLHALWHFTLRNAWRDQNLEPWGDSGVERAARWRGQAGALVAALREARFLDGYVVHGWAERAGRLVNDRIRKEKSRKCSRIKSSGGQVADKLRTSGGQSGATVPYPTQPYPTEQKQSPPGGEAPAKDAGPPPGSPAVVPKRPKPPPDSPQRQIVERFKAVYTAQTGEPYDDGRADYALIADLIRKHGMDAVVAKARTLYQLCLDGSAWFTKDGWRSFTIRHLKARWNEILAPPGADETVGNGFLAELKKQEELRARAYRGTNGAGQDSAGYRTDPAFRSSG